MQPAECIHGDRDRAGGACAHLLLNPKSDYVRRFTGVGKDYDLLCFTCAKEETSAVLGACSECFQQIEQEGSWEGILGRPAVKIGQRNARFEHEMIQFDALRELSIIDVQPIERFEGVWLACTSTGSLVRLDVLSRSAEIVARLGPDLLDFDGPTICEPDKSWLRAPRCMLRVSRNGDLAAVANTYGTRGAVVDLAAGKTTMVFRRDEYHEDVSAFPLAFAESNGSTLLIHGTAWNRLDISNARTGVLLTARKPTSYKRGEARPAHYLDYFHCQLTVSPAQQFIADNGWAWHPVGVITTWNLQRWLKDNVWESEDGNSKRVLRMRDDWDVPVCWIDDHRLAVWGYGPYGGLLIDAAVIFNVQTAVEEQWFPGPQGSLAADEGYLFSFDKAQGSAAWDLKMEERVAHEPTICFAAYHRGGKHFVSFEENGIVRMSRLGNG